MSAPTETTSASPPSRRRSRTSPPGRMVVVVDDEDRENEGDLVMAAEFVTPDAINFMATPGARLDLPGADARALRRARARADGGRRTRRPRDAVHGHDRGARGRDDRHQRRRPRAHDPRRPSTPTKGAARHRQAAATSTRSRPSAGGVLERTGHTEASVDLARLAGLRPGRRHLRDHERGRLDGPRRRPRAPTASSTACKMITIADLIAYRRRHDKLVERVVATTLPTAFGDFDGGRLPLAGRRQAPRRAGQGRRRRARATCSCACTPSA